MTDLIFLEEFQTCGEAPALVGEEGGTISYAELGERVRRRRSAMGSGRKLAVLAFARDAESIVSYLAALAAGHPVILADPEGEAVEEAAAQFGAEFVLRGEEIERRSPALGAGLPHPDLAVLLRTSGSMGCAKFVRLSRRNLASNAEAIASYLGLAPGDRGVLSLPLHYSYGLSILNSHLARGASVLVSERSVIDPAFLDAVERAGCTSLSGVPYSYELFERVGLREKRLPHLRTMTVAGGRLASDMVRLYAAHMNARGGRFFAMYGQTEATARIAYLPPEQAAAHPDEIGRAIPGGELVLAAEDGREIVSGGETGELIYRGPNVMMGYATEPRDIERGHEVQDLRTGDLAVRTANGFRIVGRKSRFSKIAGLRIGHAEVEAKLAAQGWCAAVVGDDRRLFAAMAGAGDPADALADLAAASGLPGAYLDASVAAELPRLPSGKIDYARLRAEMEAQQQENMEPEGVREAFAEAFYPREVRASDSFVSLGGDSLTYVRLSIALERLLGDLPDGWERRPVSSLRRTGVAASGTAETDFALRAGAALSVVVHHATQWPLAGGAAVLLLLAGFNLARFQSANLFAGRVGPMLISLLRNLLPYYLVLAIYGALLGGTPWQVLTLTSNLGLGGFSPVYTPYIIFWFIEAYAHILVGAALLFSVPQLRRAVAARPFEAGLVLLSAALATRFAVYQTWGDDILRVFTTGATFYVFVFGWCLAFADTARRKAAALLLALVVFPVAEQPAFLEKYVKVASLIAAAALVLYVPRLALPRPVLPAVLTLAAASYPIYLFHDVPSVVASMLGVPFGGMVRTIAVIATGLVLGLAVYAVQSRLTARRGAAVKKGQSTLARPFRNWLPGHMRSFD